ncbi:MAG: sugar ABC transporter permease [Desulfobacula sp.]|jgi:multiple sugar transport system permease protein|nr:sugar ABC transporter permease [Desulfobacula sp.]
MALSQSTKDSVAAWSMSLPAIACLFLFMVAPFILSVILSLTSYQLNSPLPVRWVGFDNYVSLFTISDFPRAMLNNVIFTAVVVPLQIILALIFALLVNQRLKGMIVFRTLFFMPVIYPMALVSIVWGLIFAPGQTGVMNQILELLSAGLWNANIGILHNKYYALPCIMVISIWQGVGFQMVILLAALQSISETLYEAARIDRAGKWSRFWYITLPQLRNGLIFVAVVTTILSFRLFDQVWILTQGGPENATATMMYEVYQASRERNQIGLGSSMTVIFFIFVWIIAMIQHYGIKQCREIL